MILTIRAIRDTLSNLYPCHIGQVEQMSAQYYVLTPSADGHAAEPSVAACASSSLLRLTARAESVEGVLPMLARARITLQQQMFVTTEGVATVELLRTEFVDFDETVTMPNSNRHPAYGVATYQIHKEPT